MWISHGGSSAGEPPTPEHVERWQRRMSPPENEFPAGVGITVLLANTDDVAVGLTQMEAFTTGFRFNLAVRLRQLPLGLVRGELFMHISSHAPEVPLEKQLLVGIEYPDGRRASSLGDIRALRPGAVMEDDRLVLVPQGGSGAELAVDQGFWVAPLPPPGPVTVVVTWPGFGLEETRTVLDGDRLLTAATASQILWPPQSATEPPESPTPPRPTSGWFAEPSD